MQAAVYHGKEQIIVQQVADPTLEAGDVLLEIEACNVCGTDLRTYRHGDKKITPPRILGHEFCGRVVESKNPDANVKIGDRVLMYIVLSCGECRYCKAGRENLCTSRTTMSYHLDGAFAPLMRVPEKAVRRQQLFKVSEELPSEHLSLAEPLGCVINAHGRGRLEIGLKDRVAVIGAGPIGVLHALVSRYQGAQQVDMYDVMQARLDKLSAFDIDNAVRVEKEGSHLEKALELTDGLGYDVVIVAVSVAQAQADALEIAGKMGRVEYFGGLPKTNPFATLNTNHLHYKELKISGSYSEKMSDFQAATALVQKKDFPSDKIVTHLLPLERITEAFTLMESGEALKVSIKP
ncbi:MAG: alcohol dehydrogenase catalytic domain-containing protein [Spirosomaceae bacterium]|jgi:L-iditol 2-dehydrogenase|nr:alcohol dehydrogenase catalytic domain-containing protein [Spirosomataceae bacterium]